MEPKPNKLAEDLIIGGRAIADELGINEDKLHHWIRKGRIPVGHIGKTLIARRSELQKAIKTA